MRYGYAFYSKNFYPKYKFVVTIMSRHCPLYKPVKRLAKVRRITKRNFSRIIKSSMPLHNNVHFSKIYY